MGCPLASGLLLGCPPRLELRVPLRASLQAGLPNRELPSESLVLLGKLMQKERRGGVAEGRDLESEGRRRAKPATQGQELELSQSKQKAPKGLVLEGP